MITDFVQLVWQGAAAFVLIVIGLVLAARGVRRCCRAFPRPRASMHPLGWMHGFRMTLVGLAVSSRLLAVTALLGAAVGLAVSAALGGTGGAGIVGNSVPTAIALGGVFLAFSPAALLVAALGAATAGALWWTLMVYAALPLPVLVAPFSLVTIGVVTALRLPRLRRLVPGRPAPLPLASIGSPEAARRARLAQDHVFDLGTVDIQQR